MARIGQEPRDGLLQPGAVMPPLDLPARGQRHAILGLHDPDDRRKPRTFFKARHRSCRTCCASASLRSGPKRASALTSNRTGTRRATVTAPVSRRI